MIPHVILHSNTDLPYSMWEPAYAIVLAWEGSVPRTPWISYHLWKIAQPEAEKVMQEYLRQGAGIKRTYNLPRFRQDICEAIVVCLRANGFQVELSYPSYKENHCRPFTLMRR